MQEMEKMKTLGKFDAGEGETGGVGGASGAREA
jgi:hypothetical protein